MSDALFKGGIIKRLRHIRPHQIEKKETRQCKSTTKDWVYLFVWGSTKRN
jgi:hypothetical protein